MQEAGSQREERRGGRRAPRRRGPAPRALTSSGGAPRGGSARHPALLSEPRRCPAPPRAPRSAACAQRRGRARPSAAAGQPALPSATAFCTASARSSSFEGLDGARKLCRRDVTIAIGSAMERRRRRRCSVRSRAASATSNCSAFSRPSCKVSGASRNAATAAFAYSAAACGGVG